MQPASFLPCFQLNLCSLLGVIFNLSVFIVEKAAKPYKQYPIDIDKLTQAQIHTVSDEEFPLLILEGQREMIADTLHILQRDQWWKEDQVKDKAKEINKMFFDNCSSTLDESACNKLLSTTDSKDIRHCLGKLLNEWKKRKDEAQSVQDGIKAAEQRLQELDAEIKKIKQDRK